VGELVSWLVIERGWRVVARDGSEVGKVEDVIGDPEQDIFSGLSVSTGLLHRPRRVPSERVAGIAPGRVQLDLDRHGFADLPAYEATRAPQRADSTP